MKKLVILLLAVAAVAGCKNRNNAAVEVMETETEVLVPAAADTTHTSQVSLDYTGTYKGTLPCADCQGIETTLTIANDSSFTRVMKYMGKKDNNEFTENGKYKWNAEGSIIELEGLSAPAKYQVAENKLIQLDQEGKVVTGELAESYVLVKQQ